MKEQYEKPETKLNEFEIMDVITTSGGGSSTPPWGGEEVPFEEE